MNDSFSLSSVALPATRVLAFRGTEALSCLYHFEINLFIEDPAFDMGAALGADATLAIDGDEGGPQLFHGILASLETVGELAHGTLYVPTRRVSARRGAGSAAGGEEGEGRQEKERVTHGGPPRRRLYRSVVAGQAPASRARSARAARAATKSAHWLRARRRLCSPRPGKRTWSQPK